jgi:hypothetical protein
MLQIAFIRENQVIKPLAKRNMDAKVLWKMSKLDEQRRAT